MEIGSSYGVNGLWDLGAVSEDSTKKYKKIESQVTPSGDSVEISNEARELFSQMIHKYDHASGQNARDDGSDSQTGGGENGGGAAGGSSSGSDIESLKNQVQSLKSQLSSLAAQASKGDNAAMSKMNALEAQIAALEAQINAMGQA